MGNIVSTIRQLRLFGLSDKLKAAKTLRGPTLHQAPKRGNRASMSHVAQSFLRGLLVVAFVLLPAMLLPGISQDVAQAATLIALDLGGCRNGGNTPQPYPGLNSKFRRCQALIIVLPFRHLVRGRSGACGVATRGSSGGDPGRLGCRGLVAGRCV